MATKKKRELLAADELTLEEIEFIEGESGYLLEEIHAMESKGRGTPKAFVRVAAYVAYKREHPGDLATTPETLKRMTMKELTVFIENLALEGNPTKGPASRGPASDGT